MNDCKTSKEKAKKDLSEDLKVDWLVSNAVVAFAGALMLGQYWQRSDGDVEILFNWTVPNFSDMLYLGIIAFLLALSLIFALASLIPKILSWGVRAWVTYHGRQISPLLGFFACFSFFFSLLSALSELPDDQWWAPVLAWGGMVMFLLFMPVQMIFKPTCILMRGESPKPCWSKPISPKPENSDDDVSA